MKRLIGTTILYFVIFQCLVCTSFAKDFSDLNTISSDANISHVISGEKAAININEMSFQQNEISNIEMMAISGGGDDDMSGPRILFNCILIGLVVYAASMGAI